LTALARRSKASWGYPKEWLDEWKPLLTFSPGYLRSHANLVAERVKEVVGVAVLQVEFGRAELAHLWVDPAHFGTGIGSALLAGIKDLARERGHRQIRIESDPNAKEFYESRGAVMIGMSPAPVLGRRRFIPVLELSLGEGGPPHNS
jgi:GNAT superfamily N-acetyltransferase